MRVVERIEALVALLPDDATVQIPIGHLRQWLKEDGLSTTPIPVSSVAVDLTVAHVATALGRAESTVRAWCHAGKFPQAYRLNRKEWRIPPEGLRAFQDAQRQGVHNEPPRTARQLSRAWAKL